MSQKTLLFVPSYGGDFNALWAIAEASRERLGLALTMLIADMRKFPAEMIESARQRGVRIAECSDYLKPPPSSRIASILTSRRRNQHAAHRALADLAPSLVISTGDLFENQFVSICRARHTPTLYVQWVDMFDRNDFYNAVRSERREKFRTLHFSRRLRRHLIDTLLRFGHKANRWPMDSPFDRFAVIGERSKEMCARAGIDLHRVDVTGSLQCDRMFACRQMTSAEIADVKTTLGIAPHREFILYAREAGRVRRQHITEESAIFTAATILNGCRVAAPSFARVVKLHPREDAEVANQLRQIDPEAIIVTGFRDIGPIVAASSLVVSTISTSLLWAVGIDRPAISAFFWEGAEEMRAARHWNGVEKVDDPQEIGSAIRRNLFEECHRNKWRSLRLECRNHCLTSDGHALERLVDKVASMVAEGPRTAGMVDL